MSKQKRRKRGGHPAAGAKMLISVSAVAATLVGWGALASDEIQPAATEQPVQDVRSKVHELLGDMPELVKVEKAAPVPEKIPEATPELRVVTLPQQDKSSQPKPVSSTQSSR
jgi:hypothetical protein